MRKDNLPKNAQWMKVMHDDPDTFIRTTRWGLLSVGKTERGAKDVTLIFFDQREHLEDFLKNYPPAEGEYYDMHFCDFSGIDLSGVDLRNANISEINFSGANFEGALLDGARVQGSTFVGANITAEQLENTIGRPKDMPEQGGKATRELAGIRRKFPTAAP